MTLARVEVRLPEGSAVSIGPGAIDAARASLSRVLREGERACLVTDERVGALYAARLLQDLEVPLVRVANGEACKDFAHLQRVLEFLADSRLQRSSTVVTLGGGAVSDLGGLAAALYMRGTRVIHCATTLLAQVDAAIGGKTAINSSAGKNLFGSFHHPSAVFCDTSLLASLDEADWRSGLGEVVKYGLVAGEELLVLLEADADGIAARDPERLGVVVEACVRVKVGVVGRDPDERGERKILNLGHTFAHAIESGASVGAVPHGVAVAVGLVLALDCSAQLGVLEDPDLPLRARALLERFGLPTSPAALPGPALRLEPLLEAMELDKKNRAGDVRLVLPRAAGRLAWDVEVTRKSLRALLVGLLAPR